MLPTEALRLLAMYVDHGVNGLSASYPATSKIVPPHLNVFWEDAQLAQDLDPVRWLITARCQLLVGAVGIPEKEILRAEQFLQPIADLFTTDQVGSVAYHLEDSVTGDRANHCMLTRATASSEITVAGTGYYGAELFFEILLRRPPGSN